MFYTEIQNGHQKWRKNGSWGKSRVDPADNLRVKNFVKIALYLSISEISGFLRFMQKFNMFAKGGGKTFFCEKMPVGSADTLRIKNLIEIALSRSVSEIYSFLCFTQKFKKAAKSGRKIIFAKSRQ